MKIKIARVVLNRHRKPQTGKVATKHLKNGLTALKKKKVKELEKKAYTPQLVRTSGDVVVFEKVDTGLAKTLGGLGCLDSKEVSMLENQLNEDNLTIKLVLHL